MQKKWIFTLAAAIACFMIVQGDLAAETLKKGKNSCLACHSDAEKMKSLGFPQLMVTQAEAEQQTKMPASCTDCHQGNPADPTKEGAHAGLLRMFVVKKKGLQAVTRDKLGKFSPPSLEPGGKNAMVELLPKVEKNGSMVNDPGVKTVLYHDKNPADLSFNYTALEKTCGACHQKEVSDVKKSAMGGNAKQRLYKSWTNTAKGPHNCGPWFIESAEELAKNTKVPFTPDAASMNQKACNQCHVGCLDCHYTPQRKDATDASAGAHSFSKKVSALSCYGGGRASICHAGPEDRRRGGGYIGGEFANPKGTAPDVHFTKGITCVDCHDTAARDKKLFHGEVKRQATCNRCHANAVASVSASVHRNVTCEACHIQDVGAYAATFWGPGKVAGVKTPFFKYKEYYGVMKEPIIIKNQRGKWIPVKPYAMAVVNQKSGGGLKPGLAWRYPKNLPDLERTDDAYAFVGLLKGLPTNDGALAWIQMDKLSHKYGKARACESCHTRNGEQRQEVSWKFSSKGADPFEGKHTVIAGKKGLFIRDMQALTEIKVKEGWKIEDFAPWYYLTDRWEAKGNFSIPAVKKKAVFKRERTKYDNAEKSGSGFHR